MKKVFLDTNIVLDLVIKSRSGYQDACNLLQKVNLEGTEFVCSWHTLAILEYVGRKKLKNEIYPILRMVVDLFEIPETGNAHAREAFDYLEDDYEDAMQIVSAQSAGCQCIITNDRKGGFSKSPLPIFSPAEYLQE